MVNISQLEEKINKARHPETTLLIIKHSGGSIMLCRFFSSIGTVMLGRLEKKMDIWIQGNRGRNVLEATKVGWTKTMNIRYNQTNNGTVLNVPVKVQL